jgi:hypothetical protein
MEVNIKGCTGWAKLKMKICLVHKTADSYREKWLAH